MKQTIEQLTPMEDEFIPWFDITKPKEESYKVYYDGSHYVATKVIHSQFKQKTAVRYGQSAEDILFGSLFTEAKKLGLKDCKVTKPLTEFLKRGMLEIFPEKIDVDEYIAKKIKSTLHNLMDRKKRFRRKADLHRWNYFVTFTYDDTKQTEETFRKKLRKCLSNLHTRRGWKYMGVFERSPEKDRLHFHGIFYIPDGQMIGDITEKQDYDTKQHKMQVRHENGFFEEAFGRNDFKELDEMKLKYGGGKNYILKYLEKTGEKIIYSRGIPTEVILKLTDNEIAAEYMDYVMKYVVWDNVIDYELDVLKLRKFKQISLWDIASGRQAA